LSLEDGVEALAQLEIFEMKGLALSQILENIISTLDSGRLSGPLEEEMNPPLASALAKPGERTSDFA
jgi:hypothetical protein